MRILSKEKAYELLGETYVNDFIGRLSSELQLVEGTYSVPVKSGVQIALSKLFAYLLRGSFPVCLYVTGWGIATEHFDLFLRYRHSLGEKRSLMEAPVHLFERTDEDALISILCLVFFFSWDASVFDLAGTSLLQTSHDGWLEFRTKDQALGKDVTSEMGHYPVSLLAGRIPPF
jgi:hypothetical protein